jgi:hypothetical protein
MDCGHIGFVSMCFSIKFGGDQAGSHLGICKFDLPGGHVVDHLVAVHEVDAHDVVVQLGDHVHRVCKFSSFNPEIHFVNPDGSSLHLRMWQISSEHLRSSWVSAFQCCIK